MNELHRAVILKQVAPDGFDRPHAGREKSPRHQGPVDIVAPRIDARHQRADQDLHETQMQKPRRHALELAITLTPCGHQRGLLAAKLHDEPCNQPKDQESQPQMRGQAV